MNDEIFMIKARKCLRCGRLLTSSEAIEKGYGCQCALKAHAEAKALEPIQGQMSFMDIFKPKSEVNE